MAFQKGHPKYGGIKKGTVRTERQLVREIVEAAYEGKPIPERLAEIAKKSPQKEIDILLALMPYCYPKLQAIDLTGILEAKMDTTEGLQAAVDHIDHLLRLKAETGK